MAAKYIYKKLSSHRIGSVRIAVAKAQNGNLVGIQEFDLRLPMVPEGVDPLQVAIDKHRDELRW